jgi:hypothetical protein
MKNQRKKGVDVIEHPGKTSTTSVSQQKRLKYLTSPTRGQG